MTREQLETALTTNRTALLKMAKKRYPGVEEDLVADLSVRLLGGVSYIKVTEARMKSWLFYRMKDLLYDYSRKRHKEIGAEQTYYQQVGDEVAMELSDIEEQQILEEYWQGLQPYQQTRQRQRFTDEGRAWYPFMYLKK